MELPTLSTACSNSSRLTPRCRDRYRLIWGASLVWRRGCDPGVTFFVRGSRHEATLFHFRVPATAGAMRSAEKPTQPKRDSNGRVRLYPRSCGERYLRTRTPSFARIRPHWSQQRLWPAPGGVLSGALSLVDDALNLALGIASDMAKPLLDPATRVPGRTGHSMFVHYILLYGVGYRRQTRPNNNNCKRALLLVGHPGRRILVIGESGGALQFVLRGVHDEVPFVIILSRDVHGVEGN